MTRSGLEKPLMYFRKGFEIIEREPVSEITWKLAFALGEELDRRGQAASAREYFEKAQVVLKYFLSGFESDKMKENYLKEESRSSVFAHD
jgi:hypothetical protein